MDNWHDKSDRQLLLVILENQRTLEKKMSQLSDAVDKLVTDDTALESEVDALIAVINGIPAVTATAVQTALTNAGVDDAAATTALAAVDAAVTAETQKAVAALQPAPPAA